MNIKHISILSLLCCLCGSIFYVIQKELVVFRFSQTILDQSHPAWATNAHKKEITCYFWHNNNWQEEKKECIWSNSKEANLKKIVAIWLTTLDQEQLTTIKITAQLVALNTSGYQAFISFDHHPLPQNGPLYLKLMWIEGLLKTIKKSGITIQSVQFLHNHQPLQDNHLDFSQPWPITGFI